ncbi:hypothetical protein E7T06_12605 [Deinococcus sp. Arct2-2]|uniref:hypothetical protein n=1 Tax=Deinococcus sp. Arct2-2 TaxID=2568653 RepID=UPI0010A4923C|nr:hypothetical protein [Deinococcus sp. Arct2-2]THF69323.1 hypothetical protein E7T06_12605 [Deinococcus sp. Arct2-2]
MLSPMPTYEEWRASEENSLREAREAGEAVTHMLEGQPDHKWRRHYDGCVTLYRAFAALSPGDPMPEATR